MEQPVPRVSGKDVERVVLRDFGEDKLSQAKNTLERYGRQEWTHPGSARVRLAILKLANGDLEQLTRYTEAAIEDFRDVIAMAEYPWYSAKIGSEGAGQEVRREAIEADREQYLEWLNRE